MKRLVALCLLALAASAQAASFANDLQARLQPFQVLHGRFEQSKQLKGIRRPLKSVGRFVVAKGQGVLWFSERPIATELRITEQGLSIFSHGVRQEGLDKTPAPQRLIGDIALSVFSSDSLQLQKHFTLSGTVDGPRWQAALAPKDAALAKAIRGIHLQGSAFAETLDLNEANGDQTHIVFTGVRAGLPLSADEKKYFP